MLAALTIALSMRIVGILLIAALMVLPVIAAQRIAWSLRSTMAIAIAIGLASVLVGLTTSYYGDLPPGGTIVLAAAAFFVVASGARAIHRRVYRARYAPADARAARPPLPRPRAGDRRRTSSTPTTGRRSTTAGRRRRCRGWRSASRELDLELTDIRHLLLSHIHFDHAGAAGSIVRRHPALTSGSPRSARRTSSTRRGSSVGAAAYGDDFDRFWGELVPVPERNVRIAAGDVVGWEAFPTPGHASHHVCYFRDGLLLAGDACGIRIQPARYILPPTPPPDIDVEAWHASIDEIARREPERSR